VTCYPTGPDNDHDVLDVHAKVQLGRTSGESDKDLEGEPSCTDGLDDEERIGKIRRLVVLAVRHGKVR